MALFALSTLGRPKDLTATLARSDIASVSMGETSLFGQKMPEIVIDTVSGAEVGFGVAKIKRRQGDEVVSALGG